MAIPSASSMPRRRRVFGTGSGRGVALAALIGILVGLGATALYYAIDGATHLLLGGIAGLTPPTPAGEGGHAVTDAARPWLLPACVALGALVSGVIAAVISRDVEGGGTDAAISAFHDRGGHLARRVPPAKLIASAIVLGSGGSAGREGPAAQIGAGIASWLGEAFRLDARDRRIAAAVGMGAGIGTIFKAPLGGAILSAEMLYIHDFEIEAIIPGLIASVIGYSIFGAFSGWTPTFGFGESLRFDHPASLGWYALLGILAGIVVLAYARVFFATRGVFRRVPLPSWIKPAIGGLAVGFIALRFPEVLSMGYGWVQVAMDGNTAQLAVWTMLALVGLKILATSLTIGSGASGGDFAPVLYVGAMVGGGMWGLLHGHVAGLPSSPAPFVIVGMMALLAGAAKAPLAVMIMVGEMTGEFSMVVPAMVAAGLAYVVSGNTTLYGEQRPTRADSPAHRDEFTVPFLRSLTVEQAMRTEFPVCAPSASAADVVRRLTESGLSALPVVEDGRLAGVVRLRDAVALADPACAVADVMSTDMRPAGRDDTLHATLQLMAHVRATTLPVVDGRDPSLVIGVIDVYDLAEMLDVELSTLLSR